VDDELVTLAAERLQQLHYQPTVVAGDGVNGYRATSPFDRILATCSTWPIPTDWIEQLAEDGVLLCNVLNSLDGGLVRITKTTAGCASGHLHHLWDTFESTYHQWINLGRPQRNRHGISITPDQQGAWPDDPASEHQWPVRTISPRCAIMIEVSEGVVAAVVYQPRLGLLLAESLGALSRSGPGPPPCPRVF
jgi:hypothetical protein